MAVQVAPEIRDLAPNEGQEIFDEAARRHAKVSGEDFLRRWDAGEFRDTDDEGVLRVVMLMPLVRRQTSPVALAEPRERSRDKFGEGMSLLFARASNAITQLCAKITHAREKPV